ncbi:MAG: hypothetical protein H5U21_07355, partial [Porphyrobacter sp.]|nr:hypothetical protein [Porphyrobacter sp.]
LVAPAPAPAAPAPAPAASAPAAGKPGGSTLFERMAGLSRPAAMAEEPAPQPESAPEPAPERRPDSGSSLRIPRFLGRQNNQ